MISGSSGASRSHLHHGPSEGESRELRGGRRSTCARSSSSNRRRMERPARWRWRGHTSTSRPHHLSSTRSRRRSSVHLPHGCGRDHLDQGVEDYSARSSGDGCAGFHDAHSSRSVDADLQAREQSACTTSAIGSFCSTAFDHVLARRPTRGVLPDGRVPVHDRARCAAQGDRRRGLVRCRQAGRTAGDERAMLDSGDGPAGRRHPRLLRSSIPCHRRWRQDPALADGPNVSIGAGTVIDGSEIRDTIIGVQSAIRGSVLANSLIGDHVVLEGVTAT